MLIFGQAFAQGGGPADPKAAVAALSDDAEICGCNGVSKGKVVACDRRRRLRRSMRCAPTARRRPPAARAPAWSRSCSRSRWATIMAASATARRCANAPASATTTCAARSSRRSMKSIPEVMQELDWTTPDGCSSCRPALNYYLLCAWPGEYVDDQQSRFVNERMHANIQKDGTYSVVPRMWGGMTNAARAARDRRRGREVSTRRWSRSPAASASTSSAIKKEDLPAVWADLNAAGMVSGHAYGKALRTVKTCVGSEWCRFGTQDSTGLGVKLEQMTWGSWMPHKFKIAVSGCPRNCAEATIKDFGVVCVDSGYELHVGGNGGIKVRAAPICCARSRPRRRRWIIAPPSSSSTARRRAISSAPRRGSSASASTMSSARIVDDEAAARRCAARFLLFAELQPGRSLGRARRRRGRANSMRQHRPNSGPSMRSQRSNAHDRRLDRRRPGRRHPRARRAHRAGRRRRGDRGVPHRRRPGVRAGQPLPAQAGAAEPGHRPRPRRGLPAAQLAHRAGHRRGAGRRTRAARRRSR